MVDPLNPQAREMADESMVRTLAAQADAIWPQERPLFTRYRLPADAYILDAGCGTGLCGPLVAPHAQRLTGVDLSAGMLAQASEKGVYDELGSRVCSKRKTVEVSAVAAAGGLAFVLTGGLLSGLWFRRLP